jgi:hypothetical protein
MKKLIGCLVVSIFISLNAISQEDSIPIQYDKASVGPGIGLDYGGIGLNITFYPHKNFGLFGSCGYAFAGIGYNAGLKVRIVPEIVERDGNAYFLAMYGYNAAIKVSGTAQYSKIFDGFSFGAGIDYRASSKEAGYWSVAVLIPIRSPEVKDYIYDLENNHGLTVQQKLSPIGISIGYHFRLN